MAVRGVVYVWVCVGVYVCGSVDGCGCVCVWLCVCVAVWMGVDVCVCVWLCVAGSGSWSNSYLCFDLPPIPCCI